MKVSTASQEIFQPAQISLDHVLVLCDGKDQGHIDAHPLPQNGPDGGEPLRCGGDFDHQVWPVNFVVEADGLGNGAGGIVGEGRADFQADKPVGPVAFFINRAKRIAASRISWIISAS